MKGSMVREKSKNLMMYETLCVVNENRLFQMIEEENAVPAEICRMARSSKERLSGIAELLLMTGEISSAEYSREMEYITSTFDTRIQFGYYLADGEVHAVLDEGQKKGCG